MRLLTVLRRTAAKGATSRKSHASYLHPSKLTSHLKMGADTWRHRLPPHATDQLLHTLLQPVPAVSRGDICQRRLPLICSRRDFVRLRNGENMKCPMATVSGAQARFQLSLASVQAQHCVNSLFNQVAQLAHAKTAIFKHCQRQCVYQK